jgi:hypothetical protein
LAAQQQFRTFVASELDDVGPFAGLLVGSPNFARRFEPMLRPYGTEEDHVYADRFAARPPLSTLLLPGLQGPKLDAAIRRAFLEYAYTLREMGTSLGRPSGTIWSWIQRAEQQESGKRPDRKLRSDPNGTEFAPGRIGSV